MKTLVLCFLCLTGSGCVLSRSLRLPDESQVLEVSPQATHWAVSEVFVRSSVAGAGGQIGEPRQYQELKRELETRLRSTLQAQTLLGHQAEGAPYEIEVLVDVEEAGAASPWFCLGLGLEVSILSGGAAVGAVVAGPPGALLGMLAATPPAIVAALVPPVTTESGQFEATLTIRRRVDGAAVATRHVVTEWKAELNGFERREQLAAASGAAVPQLEKALLEALYAALQALPAS